MRSYEAKLLAVRKVTQDNKGKKTAGVDGVSSVRANQRFKLVESLKLSHKAKATRRVWIPKPNGEKRPLGIPTMYDRALQALVKMALEPEWEAFIKSKGKRQKSKGIKIRTTQFERRKLCLTFAF